jgi:hypothetical protein
VNLFGQVQQVLVEPTDGAARGRRGPRSPRGPADNKVEMHDMWSLHALDLRFALQGRKQIAFVA